MLADAVLGLREYLSCLNCDTDGKLTELVLNGSFTVEDKTITYHGRVSVKLDGSYSIAVPSEHTDLLPKIRDHLAKNGGYEVEPTDSFMYPARFDVRVTGGRSETRQEETAVKRTFRDQLIATIYTV